MWGDLFNSVDLLKKGMDAGWLRNEVISNNIANEDTVGFKASEVEFENLFAQSLQGKGSGGSLGLTVTDARHISNGGSSATDSSGAGAVRRQQCGCRTRDGRNGEEHDRVLHTGGKSELRV